MKVRTSGGFLPLLKAFGAVVLLSLCASSNAFADDIPLYPPVPDPNIITFADAAQSCGGAVLCSTNGTLGLGTQGYVKTGNTPFNLSTITQWFQIDPDGVSHLANQPAEPLGDSGGFLVINDTGAAVTTFSLTITDTFTSNTPSVGDCKAGPQFGKQCDNFQNHGGSAYAFNTELSGTYINDCTQGTPVGHTCVGGPGGIAADFAPGTVTYTWTATNGVSIAAGAKFDITFASWNNDAYATPPTSPVPEPSSMLLFGTGLSSAAYFLRRSKKLSGRSVSEERRFR